MLLHGGAVAAADVAGATAVLVRQGRIAFVGQDDEARALADAGTVVVDLRGRLVTPAFVDAHVHCVQVGQVADGIDLHHARSRDAVLDAVAAAVASRPERRVLVGQGWDERGWPDPTPPTRAELDRAAPGVAVYLARVTSTRRWSPARCWTGCPTSAACPGSAPTAG